MHEEAVDYVAFGKHKICCHGPDSVDTEQRPSQVVEHSKKDHDVERAVNIGIEFINGAVLPSDLRTKRIGNRPKARYFRIHNVERNDLRCTTSFALKRDTAVVGTDIEYTTACEIGGNTCAIHDFHYVVRSRGLNPRTDIPTLEPDRRSSDRLSEFAVRWILLESHQPSLGLAPNVDEPGSPLGSPRGFIGAL